MHHIIISAPWVALRVTLGVVVVLGKTDISPRLDGFTCMNYLFLCFLFAYVWLWQNFVLAIGNWLLDLIVILTGLSSTSSS
jgi:hypothetical protein